MNLNLQERILSSSIGKDVNTNPIVSVIIPAYNVADFIAETLDSSLSQTFGGYEIVVVNDGSPDTEKLEKVLGRYFDQIVYLKQINGGASVARNTGILFARGTFIAFLDGDDIWLPTFLEEQVKFISGNDLEFAYADALLFGNPIWDDKTYMQTSPSNGKVSCESLIRATCNVITSGTIAKRQKILDVGGFDENLPRIGMEDFDLWFRLLRSGVKADYRKEVLLKYRIRAGSLSGDSVQRAQRTVKALEIVQEKFDLTASETQAMNKSFAKAQAALKIEIGKSCLLQGKFDEARENFAEANKFAESLKLKLVNMALSVSPSLLVKIFKIKRSHEIPLIPKT